MEPRPYIIRFVEDKPNPLYRRVCYTFAWSIVITFAVLNFAGLVVAVATGVWRLKQIYQYGYFPIAVAHLDAGRAGIAAARESRPPKAKATSAAISTARCGPRASRSRCSGLLWKMLPHSRTSDAVKLAVFTGLLALFGWLAHRGVLPRTRPIVPGELAISD